jgi:hypothetical protein
MMGPLGGAAVGWGLGRSRRRRGFPDWRANVNNVAQFLAAVAALDADQADTVTTFGSLAGAAKWVGGVLAPNGCIYGIPRDSTAVLKIDPSDSISTFGSLSADTNKWYGGVLAPNGCIYGIPFNSTTVLKIDPSDDSISTFGSLSGTGKWFGGVLAPNGCIYGIPFNSTTVLKLLSAFSVNANFPLHRAVNKY